MIVAVPNWILAVFTCWNVRHIKTVRRNGNERKRNTLYPSTRSFASRMYDACFERDGVEWKLFRRAELDVNQFMIL